MSFAIPEEFSGELRYVDSLDTRSDEEILGALTKYAPITSERNIWTYWHSGVQSMPGWCQRNVLNWIRLSGPSWTIHVLDSIPDSANNALKYVPTDMLPDTFVAKTMDGPYVGPHSADFLRGACLFLYGGVWMDVGIILLRQLDRICWKQLEDPGCPFEVAIPLMYDTFTANHMVASRKGSTFIRRWHDLFVYLWQDRTNPNGLISHPLIASAKEFKFEESEARNFNWEFKVEPQTVMDYIGQVLAWRRLCMLDGSDGVEYWMNKVLLFDSLTECWGAEATIGFSGEDLFDTLATRLDADRESKEYKRAYKTIWRLLTRSSIQKVTHGKHLTKGLSLGILWDMDENSSADVAPGTFAELLRYGSVHFEQTRASIDYVDAPRPDHTLKKGLFEP